MKNLLCITGLCFALVMPAQAFEFTFDWGNIPRCTSGQPGRVSNPTFKLAGVPEGTKALKFMLRDQDAPDFSHGGGTVAFAGSTISPGAFTYLSPCPPNGKHTYVWDASALDATGKKIAGARSKQQYP